MVMTTSEAENQSCMNTLWYTQVEVLKEYLILFMDQPLLHLVLHILLLVADLTIIIRVP